MPEFLAATKKLMDDEERAELVAYLAYAGCGKTSRQRLEVSGHDFSRAEKAAIEFGL
jgi:hypothetical protein